MRPQGLSVDAQLFSDARLLLPELREIQVHAGHGCGFCKQSQMDLVTGLRVEVVYQLFAISHPAGYRCDRLMDRRRFDYRPTTFRKYASGLCIVEGNGLSGFRP
ncbi:hypothetical protein C8J45_11367 [Sphingomonas sp. PP-CE-3G-477]|nr:hypothetical protein C8J45_11367 [Sphingomonas sp. PP-CE-3G-477]